MKTLLKLSIIIFSIFGMIDAGYVSYTLLQNLLPVCYPGFKCAEVLTSPWLNFGPISVSYLGFIFFTLFLLAGSANLLDLKIGAINIRKWLKYQSIVGFFFAIYVLGLMGLILQAWCLYCLISGLNALILFALTQTWLQSERKLSD